VLGKHEIIDYTVALTPEGKVLAIEILEYRESYGYEIRGAKWRQQFVGKGAANSLRLNKDIYNISGATMSCRHVTEGIRRVLATFDLLCRPQLAAGGVPNSSGN
jgi:Na+-translocating ferredoxin:NAD+ oxidoreductase RnfG subunit